MRRKLLLLLAVGCLVALAGCTGTITDDEPTLDDVTYPDGVSENGTNVSALAASHSDALENRSFTLRLDMTENATETNYSASMRAAVGPDRDRINATITDGEGAQSTYLSAEKRYVRSETNEETAYRVADRNSEATQLVSASYSGATYLRSFAGESGANFTPTGVEVVDGTTLVKLEADGDNASVPNGEVVGYDATMLVDEEGVVHRFEVTASTEFEGDERSITLSMELSNVDETSVEEPSWLDEARNQTGD